MTFVLAFWGAVLSTLLGLRTLSTDWPRLLLRNDPEEEERLTLGVKNESKHSIVLHRIAVHPRKTLVSPNSGSSRSAIRTAMNVIGHGDLQIVIEPDIEQTFSFTEPKEARVVVLVVFWSSARLGFLPKIPLVVFLRRSKIDALRRGSKAVTNQLDSLTDRN